jgi:TolA-binding protein
MQRIAALLLSVLLIVSSASAQTPGADPGTKKILAANGLFQRQLYKLAAEQYADFLRDFPNHREAKAAKYALAICHYRLNDFEKAAKTLDELLADPAEFPQRDEAMLVLGYCRLSLKDYQKTVAVFDELIAKFPDSASAETAMLNRSQALLLMGNSKAAEEAAQSFMAKYPKSKREPEALYFLALALRSNNKLPDAALTLRQLLDQYPDSKQRGDAMLALGQVFDSLDQHDKAVQQYEALAAAIPEKRAEAYYSLAVSHYNHAAYDQAISALTRLLQHHADSAYGPPARLQLGLTQLAAKKIDDARKTLSDVVQKDRQRATTARYWLAQCDIAEKKFDSARATLDELAKTQPPPANLEQIIFDRAQCTMSMEKSADAAVEFADFAQKYATSPRRSEAVYREAFCLHKSANYAKSLDVCQGLKLEESNPLYRSTRELIAENLLLLTRYDEAVAAYDDLRKKADTDALKLKYSVRLGQAAYFGGDTATAIETLKPLVENKTVLADPDLARGILVLGGAYLHDNRNKEAADIFARYLQSDGTEKPEAQFKQALALQRAGDSVAAEKTFADLAKSPQQSTWTQRAVFEVGQIAYRAGDRIKASNAFKKLLASNPPPDLAAPPAYLLAWLELDAKRPEEAATAFAQLAEKYPDHALAADARFYQAVALRDAGRDQEALNLLQDFVKQYENNSHAPQARQLIAASLVKLQKHQEAIATLQKLAADPKTTTDEVLYDLAWSQQSAKDSKSSEATYRRLLNEFPSSKLSAAARSELAEILFQQGKYQESAELLEKSVADTSADAKTVSVALYRLGSAYEKLGQPAKAADTFNTFLDKHGNDELAGWAHYQAGVSLARQDKLDEAKKHFQTVLASKPKVDLASVSLLKLAEVTAQQGNYTESEILYKQFLDKYPNDRFIYQAQFGIGWALENQKKYDDARAWYGKVIAQNSSPTAARAQFQIGETWFAEGKYDQAAAALLAVADVYAYPEWAARATFEAGRVFEQMKQPDSAKQQYSTVVNKYKDAPEAPLAQKRLAALDQ